MTDKDTITKAEMYDLRIKNQVQKTERSYLRGHLIIYTNGEWVYFDTRKPTVGNPRPCGKCGQESTPEGNDACLGSIPGVVNACCGHGDNSSAYIDYQDGKRFVIEKILNPHRRTKL